MSLTTTVICRVRQAVLRARRRSARPARPTVEEGAGSVFALGQILRTNRLHKPMVVVGHGADAWGERITAILEENDLSYSLWDMLPAVPTVDDGEKIRLQWIMDQCDCFVVLGDSAAIDMTKAAAARAACRNRAIPELVGRDKIRRKLPPVVAIPTTAGGGTETLARAEVMDAQGTRLVLEDASLAPDYAILDPELLADMTRQELAETAVDGICLAVEAYLSGYADDFARAAAADAVRGLLSAVEPCWNSGGTTDQRSALLSASRDVGVAASQAGFGYAAALSRSVERVRGEKRYTVCASILPTVLENYGNRAQVRLAELAELCGIAAENGTHADKAGALIDRLRQLFFRIGLPERLELMPREAVREIADMAAADANPWYACPAVWTTSEFAAVLRRAGAL